MPSVLSRLVDRPRVTCSRQRSGCSESSRCSRRSPSTGTARPRDLGGSRTLTSGGCTLAPAFTAPYVWLVGAGVSGTRQERQTANAPSLAITGGSLAALLLLAGLVARDREALVIGVIAAI